LMATAKKKLQNRNLLILFKEYEGWFQPFFFQ